MKWIRERDALIAQTMAFVQSVTGKKDGFHPPEIPSHAFAVTTEVVTIRETVTVQDATVQGEPPPVASPPEPRPEGQFQPVQALPVQALPTQVRPVVTAPARASSDVRSEMQARIANFRKHQERFEREREEYCAATLTRLRAAIRDPSLRPPAQEKE
jgi:hypothetical protein